MPLLQHLHEMSTRIRRSATVTPVKVYEDCRAPQESFDDSSDDGDRLVRGPLEDSGCTRSDESEDGLDEDDLVREDMLSLETTFTGFSSRFRLLNRIGEGTFSTVYKAEDLQYDLYQNTWDVEAQDSMQKSPSGRLRRHKEKKPHYVAIKKIYVTSSPSRIFNELALLADLRGCDCVAPLITAFRHQDQVVAILPYFSHQDFRTYFRDMSMADVRVYFRSLFTALDSVHQNLIIHRDVKPTNFLYNVARRRGVLVDFGLAEREGYDHHPCMCELDRYKRKRRINASYSAQQGLMRGPPKDDRRPSQRANRAGTRGFRAPEVLFKCTAQSRKIDIWSAGIMLLTILSKRFPFFHSQDDIDAVIELASIFGSKWMHKAALKHGQVFETNIPTISENGHALQRVIMWSTNRRRRDLTGKRAVFTPKEEEALDLLELLLKADPTERLDASQVLQHPFLADREGGSEDEMDILSMSQ